MEGLPGPAAARRRHRGDSGGRLLRGRRVVLWRHGRTAWNAEGRFQGQLDPPLDDVGRGQAAAAARVLTGLPPTTIVSSDADRAASTAAALGGQVRTDERLREIHLGAWQGLTGAEARERFPAEFQAWRAGQDVRRGDGETYAEVGVRAVAALTEALQDLGSEQVLVAVTHGGTARATIGLLLGLAPSSWWRFGPLGNCRWSVLLETDRGWRLTEHNAGDPPREGSGDDR